MTSATDVCKDLILLEKYKARDGKTFCNIFVHDVCSRLGLDKFKGLLANHMVDVMEQEPDEFFRLTDNYIAQLAANLGHLVIAGWKNPAGHPGHVAIVVKGALSYSGTYKAKVPNCANVGSKNFYGKPISYAFKLESKPTYWLWSPHDKEDKGEGEGLVGKRSLNQSC